MSSPSLQWGSNASLMRSGGSSVHTLKPLPAQSGGNLHGASRSAWTPDTGKAGNHKIFLERVSLITHWHDKWTERQRSQLLVHLLQKTTAREMLKIRDWLMARMPEPLWKLDPTSVLPTSLFTHILSFLNTADLCQCAQVSSHWRQLSELDVLWRGRAASRGWYLPYLPSRLENGAWKHYYVECVVSAERPSHLRDPLQEMLPAYSLPRESYTTADLRRLHRYYLEMDPALPSPAPPSRHTERAGEESLTLGLDESMLKERWHDPSKHPKDLDNWGKEVEAEYKPDTRHLQATITKLKSRSSVKLSDSHTQPSADQPQSPVTTDGPRLAKSSTITELCRHQGTFYLREEEEVRESKLVTRKSVIVPKQNCWLQKPSTRGISDHTGTVGTVGTVGTAAPGAAQGASSAAAAVGCGAVWGEVLPGHTHPRLLLISSDIPAYELVIGMVIPGVIGIVYDAEKDSLRTLLNTVEHSLRGRRAESVGLMAPGQYGRLELSRASIVQSGSLQTEFWRELAGHILPAKQGGRIDILSTLGLSTVSPEQGLVYKIAGAVNFPVNAPAGGVFGRWAELTGSWLMYPDQIHPTSIYLRQNKIREWVVLAEQLGEIASEMRERYQPELSVQGTVALHRLINSVIRQGVGGLFEQLEDILNYLVARLPPALTTHEEQGRGILVMKIVEILLASDFVKDLEKGGEDGGKKGEESVEAGQEYLSAVEWDGRAVKRALRAPGYILHFPRGVVVDERLLVLEEMIRQEHSLQRSLDTIKSELHEPLSAARDKPILNPNHLKLCFSDLTEIRQVQGCLLEGLKARARAWSERAGVGEVLLAFTRRFDAYNNYLNNYPSTIAIYRKNMNDNPAFWAFLDGYDRRQPVHRLRWFSLLSSPLDHIPRLDELLRSLLFYTPLQHPDHPLLAEAAEKVDELGEGLRKSRDQYESLGQLITLERGVSGCPILTDTKREVLAWQR